MPFISDRDKELIKEQFNQSLSNEVEIVMFTERESLIVIPGRQQCETCEPTRELLEELTGLSDKLTLRVLYIAEAQEEAAALGIDRVPAFTFKGAARGHVRFFGIPSGYEFSALIDDLIDASVGSTDLSEDTLEYLESLTTDVNIKVFTTPN